MAPIWELKIDEDLWPRAKEVLDEMGTIYQSTYETFFIKANDYQIKDILNRISLSVGIPKELLETNLQLCGEKHFMVLSNLAAKKWPKTPAMKHLYVITSYYSSVWEYWLPFIDKICGDILRMSLEGNQYTIMANLPHRIVDKNTLDEIATHCITFKALYEEENNND